MDYSFSIRNEAKNSLSKSFGKGFVVFGSIFNVPHPSTLGLTSLETDAAALAGDGRHIIRAINRSEATVVKEMNDRKPAK